ncbi:MAG: right-handed parallel beta-helix repeat-containing protein [Promethearchaeota archaeon]
MKINTKIKILIVCLVEFLFILPVFFSSTYLSTKPNEKFVINNGLNTSGSMGLILQNNYIYDYPNTQSEWWGNAEAVMNPSNQIVDGFFVSRSAGDYYSNQKRGLLIRFDVNGTVEWLRTTKNSTYIAAMVAALPNETSVLGAYHYNYENIDYFSFDKDGNSIYNWTYDPLENITLVSMKWSNGLWAVGDIETPTKGIFIRKMEYTNGSTLASNIWNLGVDTHVVGICSDNSGGLFITGWILNNSKHQLFIAHSNSSGNIVSSNIIYDDLLNVRGVACTYNGTQVYVVGMYQNGISEDKYNTYLWSFNSTCSLIGSVLLTSEAKYGIGYYSKGEDTSWIYFNYDIKILNSSTNYLIISDVIEKDYANTMIHLLDSSLNEIDYFEYKSDTESVSYHDSCGKIVITEYWSLFSIMFSSVTYSDHPYIRMVEYSLDIVDKPINIIGDAAGIDAHNWTWAVSQDWCNGSGTSSDPYIIEDLLIDGRGMGSCILIVNSSVHFKIENCTLYNTGGSWDDVGIYLENVQNGQVVENIIYDASNGILLEHSNYNNIIGNSISQNRLDGIRIDNSDHNYIFGNTVSNNGEQGIHLYFSDYNTISENTANSNSHGIHLYYSNYNDITENNLRYNSIGIYRYYGNGNNISNNNFIGNGENISEIPNYDWDWDWDDWDPWPDDDPYNPLAAIAGFAFFVIIIIVAIAVKASGRTSQRNVENLSYLKKYKTSRTIPQVKVKEVSSQPSLIKKEVELIKNCPYCDQELYLDAKFCRKCGKRLEKEPIGSQKTPLEVPLAPRIPEKEDAKIIPLIPPIEYEKLHSKKIESSPKIEKQPAQSAFDTEQEKIIVKPHFCEFCGMELNKDAVFCPQCGTKIKKK